MKLVLKLMYVGYLYFVSIVEKKKKICYTFYYTFCLELFMATCFYLALKLLLFSEAHQQSQKISEAQIKWGCY